MKKIKAKIGTPVAVLLLDILEMLKHNDYEVLRENGFYTEYEDGILEPCIEGLIDDFCKPIIEYDRDVEINLEDKKMKHVSKFDGYDYEISCSMADEDGQLKHDDITLIWRDAPCGTGQALLQDVSPREFVGWYWGEYDFKIVEDYIKKYWENKVASSKQPKSKPSKTMDLPIVYVNFIGACLHMIEEHNLYALLDSESDPETAKDHLDEVLTAFCEPLFEYDDTVIILEEEE